MAGIVGFAVIVGVVWLFTIHWGLGILGVVGLGWLLTRASTAPEASGELRVRVEGRAAFDGRDEWMRATPENRVTEIPRDGVWLRPGNRTVEVVGEASYQSAIERAAAGRRPEGVDVKVTAAIVLEPDNPHQHDAASVRIDGVVVGYLSRADGQIHRPVFIRLRELGRTGYCQARIRGGWGRDGDRGHFGVWLRLGEPSSQMKLIDQIEKADSAPNRTSATEPLATIASLADLRDRGAISSDEYEAKKRDLLGRL